MRRARGELPFGEWLSWPIGIATARGAGDVCKAMIAKTAAFDHD
jgi:hypothetical protein